MGLIQAAEKLFARHGIDGTSVRQVCLEAGARNHSAVGYHFGDKEGLVRAVFERRMPGLDRHRVDLLGGSEDAGLEVLARALVDPLASTVSDEPEASWYVRVTEEIVRTYGIDTLVASREWTRAEGLMSLLAHLHRILGGVPVPKRAVLVHLAVGMPVVGLADFERRRDAGQLAPGLTLDTTVDALRDSVVGVLGASLQRQDADRG